MISKETINTFLAQLQTKNEPLKFSDLVLDFNLKEPFLCGILNLVFSNVVIFSNPVIAATVACAMYEHLRDQQQQADELKR